MCMCVENRIKDNVVIITNRLINILCIKSEIKHAHGIILVWSKLRLLLVLVDDGSVVVMIIISNIITVYYIFIWGIHHFIYGPIYTGNMCCVYQSLFIIIIFIISQSKFFLQHHNLIHSDAFIIHLFIYFSFIQSICACICSSMASIYLFISCWQKYFCIFFCDWWIFVIPWWRFYFLLSFKCLQTIADFCQLLFALFTLRIII